MGGLSMNENLDLTKILEGCPEGTEFYHAGWDAVVKFAGIDLSSSYPIRLKLHHNTYNTIGILVVTNKGTYYDSECLLFPSKDQRDWSKFERFWDKPKKEIFDPNTLQPFDKVLVRADDGHTWRCGFVSHIVSDDFDKELVCTSDGLSVRCVPYNDETKHLVGTTEDCPDYYKWWDK